MVEYTYSTEGKLWWWWNGGRQIETSVLNEFLREFLVVLAQNFLKSRWTPTFFFFFLFLKHACKVVVSIPFYSAVVGLCT